MSLIRQLTKTYYILCDKMNNKHAKTLIASFAQSVVIVTLLQLYYNL